MEQQINECPKHQGTGMTPTDTTCHNHISKAQQICHNLHYIALQCPHAFRLLEALKGSKREHVPAIPPRTFIEKVLNILG